MADATWGKQKKKYRYRGRGITVWWDGAKCNHNGNCLRQLPGVFNVNRPRWVDADADSPERVAEVCDECPTGALSYEYPEEGSEEKD